MKKLMNFTARKSIKQFLIILGSLFYISPIQAVVPTVYEPNPLELRKTSLSIAKSAVQMLELGIIKDAIRLASLAVRIDPSDERLWTLLAEAQTRDNLLTDATNSLIKAKSIKPNKASLWFAEATLELKKNQPSNAIKLINHGLKLNPKNADAYFHLGNARIMKKEFDLALNAFKAAIDLNPKFWQAINNQGIVLFETDQIKNSINSFRKALKINNNAEPMLALAVAIYTLEGNNNEVVELTKTALKKDPNYFSSEYQKEQLWGFKLRKASKILLTSPKLYSDLEEAKSNAKTNTEL